MKKICSIALALVLTVSVLSGCRSQKPQDTSAPSTSTAAPTTQPTTQATTQPTTQATTQPTTGSTDMTGPDLEEMIPGTDDTIDPSNGANQDATGSNGIM